MSLGRRPCPPDHPRSRQQLAQDVVGCRSPGTPLVDRPTRKEEKQSMDLEVRKNVLQPLGLVRFGAVHENLPPARLVEAAVRRREGMLAENGALVASTGKRTGRSPKDKFIVEDDLTREEVAWGPTNKPFPRRPSTPCSGRPPGTWGASRTSTSSTLRRALIRGTRWACGWSASRPGRRSSPDSSSAGPTLTNSTASSPIGPSSTSPVSSPTRRRTARTPRPSWGSTSRRRSS